MEFIKCGQESFLRQHVDGPTIEKEKLDLLLRNCAGQVAEVSEGESFGISSTSFKIIKDKDRAGPQAKVQIWPKPILMVRYNYLMVNLIGMGKRAEEWQMEFISDM